MKVMLRFLKCSLEEKILGQPNIILSKASEVREMRERELERGARNRVPFPHFEIGALSERDQRPVKWERKRKRK